MLHLPTAAGGRVEHVATLGAVARRGDLLARVIPTDNEQPIEEMIAPFDALIAVQRLEGADAPRYAYIVGLRRVVIATVAGRVRWVAELGPVGPMTLVALIATDDGVRPHRSGASGFVGERFATAGKRISEGDALIEIRGEELG